MYNKKEANDGENFEMVRSHKILKNSFDNLKI